MNELIKRLNWGVFADIKKESGILVILEELILLAGITIKLTFNDKMAPVFAPGWKRQRGAIEIC